MMREAEDLRGIGTFFVEEFEEEWRRCLAINFARCGGHRERLAFLSQSIASGPVEGCKFNRGEDAARLFWLQTRQNIAFGLTSQLFSDTLQSRWFSNYSRRRLKSSYNY